MYNRIIKPSPSGSFFLFGPRGTGKSTFLHEWFRHNGIQFIGLRATDIKDLIRQDPKGFERQLAELHPDVQWIVVEELQKAPELQDVVPQVVESTNRHFVMSGSQRGKSNQGSCSVTGSGPHVYTLHPLTYLELGDTFNPLEALRWGSLPRVASLSAPRSKIRYLRDYVETFFQEEIVAQKKSLLRADSFRKFLREAAMCNGQMLNCTEISRKIGVGLKSVQAYYEFLEETLVGLFLPGHHLLLHPYRRHPKFYLFDLGFKRALEGTLAQELVPGSPAFHQAFKHLVIIETVRWASYFASSWDFSYVHVGTGVEIDLAVDRPGHPLALIQIVAMDSVRKEDLVNFQHLPASLHESECYCFSLDPQARKIGDILCLPWQDGIRHLGGVQMDAPSSGAS